MCEFISLDCVKVVSNGALKDTKLVVAVLHSLRNKCQLYLAVVVVGLSKRFVAEPANCVVL